MSEKMEIIEKVREYVQSRWTLGADAWGEPLGQGV